MLPALFLLCAVQVTRANFNVRCNNNSTGNGMTFEKVEEDIVGRYRVDLCTVVKNHYREWKLIVNFYNRTDHCSIDRNEWMNKPIMHSVNVEWTNFDSNCTNACLSKELDLIFNSCYSISSQFITENKQKLRPTLYYFNVTNNHTLEKFMNNKARVEIVHHDDDISVIWYPGIPPTEYKVELCNATDQDVCKNITSRCAPTSVFSIKCSLPPLEECVRLVFRHNAPWISGPLYSQETVPYAYCPVKDGQVSVSGGSWAGVWAAGAVLVCAAAALLARAVYHSRTATRARVHLLKTWVNRHSNDSSMIASESTKASRSILLLYARENAAGQRVVDMLKKMLQQHTDGQVYDLYSTEVMCLSARAPAEWVRGALARRDVSVLLLQTPALLALHSSHTSSEGDTLTLSAPLVPRSVVYRSPQFGDTLLQYALRLTADTDYSNAYHKFYVATLSELSTEALPRVVPYKRYILPAGAPLLIHDATRGGPLPCPPTTPLPPDSGELAATIQEFVDCVKDNPDYLMEELLIV